MVNWFKSNKLEHLDEDGLDITLQHCISRPVFLALVAIDKDLLIQGICWKIKEYFGNKMPLDEDTLSDQIGNWVNEQIKTIFISNRELRVFLNNKLGAAMLEVAEFSNNQKILKAHSGASWYQ